MDIEAIRKKMASYFDSVSNESIIEEFTKRGYTLEDLPENSLLPKNEYFTAHTHPLGDNGIFYTNSHSKQGSNLAFFI